MPRLTLAQLGSAAKRHRASRTVREVAEEIGISPATLSRVERGHTPDLVTFGKLCSWLEIDPAQILGIEPMGEIVEGSSPRVAAAHFRTDSEIDPKLATALADVILATQRMLDRADAN